MEINLTGYQLVAGMAVVCLAIVGIIYASRWYLNRTTNTEASAKPSERTKYRAYDVLRNSGVYFRVGLVSALSLTLLAFSWTSYDPVESFEFTYTSEDPIGITPPVIHPPKPKPPKPPPPVVIEIPKDPVEVDDSPTFVDPVINETPPAPPAPPAPKEFVPPPKPEDPLPPPPVEPPFVRFAQEMPRICTSCETENLTRAEKNKCAGNQMLRFVQQNIKYPTLAREVGIQGTSAVRFRVNPDGSLSHIELLKDIGAGCGAEALRATKLLQEQCWLPGKQNEKAVAVQMTLPIKFQLE